MPIKFNGRNLLVGALKLREEGQLVAYLRTVVKRPSERLRETIDLIPPEDRRAAEVAARRADEQDWPPAPTSLEGQRTWMTTPEGQRFFVALVFRKYQPTMTDAEIDEILGGLSGLDLLVLIRIAFGEDGTDPEAARAAIDGATKALQAIVAPDRADASPAPPSGANSSATSP
ncbi:MAG: hypothetical protein ACJ72N_07365 [Labedaea sp.]